MFSYWNIATLAILSGSVAAVPALDVRAAANAYAPYTTACPSSALVRIATTISSAESSYVAQRKAKADVALVSWLEKINPGFGTTDLPSLGLVLSGGGYRALLNEAGMMQALDSREKSTSVSGLLQAFTYQSSLSGGGWLSNSLASFNWPTISYMMSKIWNSNFANGLLLPDNIGAILDYPTIVGAVSAKQAAGYNVSLADLYGRLLGYNLLSGNDGGVAVRLSGLTQMSKFQSFDVPYPIITSIGTNLDVGQCSVTLNSTQYEFSPFEFGSWDTGIRAFTPTQYMGSKLVNGKPTGQCTANFDNLGLITASTSNVFPGLCYIFPVSGSPISLNVSGTTGDIAQAIENVFIQIAKPLFTELFNLIPNPFKGIASATVVSGQDQLYLGDGGLSSQNAPIWPFIQPVRNVSALYGTDLKPSLTSIRLLTLRLVADIGGDGANSYNSGASLYNVYVQAKARGLVKMPYIPPVSTFTSRNLTSRAQFFGCDEPNTVTIIWTPLVSYNYPSNISGSVLELPVAQTNGIIGNGNLLATQNGDSEWPTCLACALMKKTSSSIPSECTVCFAKYCFKN
ncbi:lysophospholipase [Aureobasidium pullulans]|uniref:Lysophospholipase n=1 Tax=Aureobasidium pullulans TaxID=5580 RepID=A0AB38LII0_AURPU|nr:lysophospholipase [Aureobasidium pullulans]THZ34459.1 lysophospholipase [Aureobasidium pullulans]